MKKRTGLQRWRIHFEAGLRAEGTRGRTPGKGSIRYKAQIQQELGKPSNRRQRMSRGSSPGG